MSLLPVGFGASGDDYEITDSLRIRNSASASLQRFNATETNRRTFTYSGWFKLGSLNNDLWFQCARLNTSNFTGITINVNQGFGIYQKNSNNITFVVREAGEKRDHAAWYHFVAAVDTTQSTSTNRVKLYVNGVLSTSLVSAGYPSQNLDTFFNTTSAVQTFAQSGTTGNAQWDGYVTETHFIDGQQLTADDFGEFDANGTWKAKKYTGTYGTNGFYLPMKPTTQADGFNTVLYTGQGSNAPQSIDGYGLTPDLVWIKSRVTGYGHGLFDSIRGPNARLQSDTTGAEAVSGTYLTSLDSDGFTLAADYGQNAPNEPYVAWGWDAGDNQPTTGISSVLYTGSGTSQKITGMGFQPDFVWIKGRSDAQYHVLQNSVTGAGKTLFSNTTTAETGNVGDFISSFDSDGFTVNNNYAGGTNNTVDGSGKTYVAWGWDAGDGDPVSNTTGSINSTVKANDANGFSVVTWAGSSATATVGHGLSTAPKVIIAKNRSAATEWPVYHDSVNSGGGSYLRLNGTYANTSSSIIWTGSPTSSVINVGSYSYVNSNNMVAYCFAEVSGVSKFGSYSGTGSAGNAITGLGFKPGFLMIKRTDTTGNWIMLDSTRNPFNSVDSSLVADLANAETANNAAIAVDFNSDGFTIQGTGNGVNNSSGTYIYMAFKGSYSDYVSPLNTTGTIDSRVKANPSKGFSIVSFTAPSGTGNFSAGHGLSTTPSMVIVKTRDSGSAPWYTWHSSFSNLTDDYIRLNATNAKQTQSSGWGAGMTSSVIGLRAGYTTVATEDHIAYCFSEVANYSKFDSYTGNGSTTGPVVTTGFRPAFVMTKRIDSSGNWYINDGIRSPNNPTVPLYADLANAEGGNGIDLLSNGFQIKNADSSQNASGGTYIYMAFAETADAVFNFDASGNKNNFTANNINSNAESETTYDLMKDTPSLVDENAANFAVLNPLDNATSSLTNGNLTVSGTNGVWKGVRATIAVPKTGSWKWEVTPTDMTYGFITIAPASASITSAGYGNTGVYAWYLDSGEIRYSGSNVATGATASVGDIAEFRIADGVVKCYLNNVLKHTYSQNLTTISDDYFPSGWYQDATHNFNFGQQPFTYNPTGFLKLNTFNLPDSTIKKGSDYFNTVLYTGNNASGRNIPTGFPGGWTWIKNRNLGNSHTLSDVVRGDGKTLFTNANNAEVDYGSNGIDLVSDGFDVTHSATNNLFNVTGRTYVAWNWKANGSGVSNTDGSITSTVSVNPTAGFSIVSYTGTNSNSTVGHGLGVAPSMVICKNRTAGIGSGSWPVWHTGLSSGTSYLFLNSTAAQASGNNNFTSAPSSTVLNLGTSDTNNTATMIAYCFAEVEGYSAFGKYTGNGSADGTFVYTGFRPAFVIIKETTSTGSWVMLDTTRSTYNVINNDSLWANLNSAEGGSASYFDMLSNGFKIRDTDSDKNSSGQTYIYMAFAENPFKNANAR